MGEWGQSPHSRARRLLANGLALPCVLAQARADGLVTWPWFPPWDLGCHSVIHYPLLDTYLVPVLEQVPDLSS